MKKHFDFTLTGKKFLPIWLVFYILIILPYAFYYKSLTGQAQVGTPNPMIGFLFLGIMIGAFIISFYILKVSIESVKYSDSQVRFEGKFGTYLGKILLGFFLSIITLTIYMAWFIRDLTRFIVNSSSVNDSNFEFQGKGGKLFLILLLSLYLPIILLSVLMGKYLITINQNFIYSLIYQGVVMIIMIPYMYLVYDWMVNIKFKEYQIKWQTEFGASCVKILVEMLLIMVTFGIYMPLGFLKLYKYFADKTIAESDDKTLHFGYELDAKGDFLFIWGQMLLTIITVGIYYPWAYSKIGKRILVKTYVENNAA
jgi:uncharacterized membrane protein YjgN (DUF898 family)